MKATEKAKGSQGSGMRSRIRVVSETPVEIVPTAQPQPAPEAQGSLALSEAPESTRLDLMKNVMPAPPSAAMPSQPTMAKAPPPAKETEARTLTASWHLFQAMLGIMAAAAMILAVRFLLLAAAAGAFGLAVMVLNNGPTWMSLSAMATYDIAVFLPLVVLFLRKG